MGIFDRNPENGALVSPIGPASGGGGSALTVQDEGSTLSAAVTKINFAGAGVTATQPVANEILITIPGGFNPLLDNNLFLPLNQMKFSQTQTNGYWGGPIDGIVFDSSVLMTSGNFNEGGFIITSDRAAGSADIYLLTGDTTTGNPGGVSLNAGNATSGGNGGWVQLGGGSGVNGGGLDFYTGSAGTGTGGHIDFSTAGGTAGSGHFWVVIGTTAGTQGEFRFRKTGVNPTIGDVWTATSTSGDGYWASLPSAAMPVLANNTYFKARNATNTADVNIFRYTNGNVFQISDGLGFVSIDLTSRLIYDSAQNYSIDYNNRALWDGASVSLDWSSVDRVVLSKSLQTYNTSTDPISPINGEIWYNTISNQLKARVNGSTVVLA